MQKVCQIPSYVYILQFESSLLAFDMMAATDADALDILYYEVNNEEIVFYVDADISDIEIDIDEDGNINTSADITDIEFDMGEDGNSNMDMDMEINEQEGGGGEDDDDGFTIQTVNERHIQKFNVHGFEYRVTIHDMANLSYLEAVQTLHRRLDRKYTISHNLFTMF